MNNKDLFNYWEEKINDGTIKGAIAPVFLILAGGVSIFFVFISLIGFLEWELDLWLFVRMSLVEGLILLIFLSPIWRGNKKQEKKKQVDWGECFREKFLEEKRGKSPEMGWKKSATPLSVINFIEELMRRP